MRSQAIACDLKKKLSFTTVRVLENASGTRSRTESLSKVFLHDNCEQISIFCLSQKGRNEKRDSFYTAKCVSSVHSCRDETRLVIFSVPFPPNKFRMCFFQASIPSLRMRALQRRPTTTMIRPPESLHHQDTQHGGSGDNARCPSHSLVYPAVYNISKQQPSIQNVQFLDPRGQRQGQQALQRVQQ